MARKNYVFEVGNKIIADIWCEEGELVYYAHGITFGMMRYRKTVPETEIYEKTDSGFVFVQRYNELLIYYHLAWSKRI